MGWNHLENGLMTLKHVSTRNVTEPGNLGKTGRAVTMSARFGSVEILGGRLLEETRHRSGLMFHHKCLLILGRNYQSSVQGICHRRGPSWNLYQLIHKLNKISKSQNSNFSLIKKL